MGLQIPPPVLAFISGLLMWALDNYIKIGQVEIYAKKSIFLALVFFGAAVAFAAFMTFKSARTTLDPMNPSKASLLVKEGIFNFSRNPMYLGILLILTGWAVYLGSVLSAGVVILFAVIMTRGQIKREEEALSAKFGEEYTAYMQKVRRWI